MSDLRKAAEMALEALNSKYIVNCGAWMLQQDQAAEALRQALAQPEEKMRIEGNGKLTTKPYPDGYDSEQQFRQSLNDKPPVKSYCGGKPNYCVPLQSDRIRIDPVTGDVSIGTVDAVNMSQDRVDKTAKGEHEPECVATIGNWGKVEWRHDVYPQLGDKLYTAPPKKEWVGLTDEESKPLIQKAMMYYGHNPDHWTLTAGAGFCILARAIEAKLKEKNT